MPGTVAASSALLLTWQLQSALVTTWRSPGAGCWGPYLWQTLAGFGRASVSRGWALFDSALLWAGVGHPGLPLTKSQQQDPWQQTLQNTGKSECDSSKKLLQKAGAVSG